MRRMSLSLRDHLRKEIPPERELFRWGPVEGKVFYADCWFLPMKRFNNSFPPGWPSCLYYVENEHLTFLLGREEIYSSGEAMFVRYILDDRSFEDEVKRYSEAVSDLMTVWEEMKHIDLTALSDSDLRARFISFFNVYPKAFWDVGYLPEIANWGGERYVSRAIRKRIEDESTFHRVFETLSAPEYPSFYAEEERELLKIQKSGMKGDELQNALEAHAERYSWMLNNYHHTEVLGVESFRERMLSWTKEEVREKSERLDQYHRNVLAQKRDTASEFAMDANTLKAADRLAYCVWWQDERKSYIMRANRILDVFFDEFASRYRVERSDLPYYTASEILAFSREGVTVESTRVASRKHACMAFCGDGSQELLYADGAEAKDLYASYVREKAEDVNEFRGVVVNTGKTTGRARVISSPREIECVQDGDILVTTMTSPEYIVGLRRASAVVTDEGGMTCHAAIVSRELGIPGIVGTKIATHVISEGDQVEVDANRGVVRIIDSDQ